MSAQSAINAKGWRRRIGRVLGISEDKDGLRFDMEKLAENDLNWTCASCGADYTKAEMDRARRRGKDPNVRHYQCTTCGAVGNFVDGPDA